MPATTLTTANNIINRVAAEIGLLPEENAYASSDPAFIQMKYLLNVAGEELLMATEWELLTKEHSFVTQQGDSGDYPLPADFFSMINQTGWDRTENVPLMGALSPQQWQYLLGRDLVSQTIYASFRLNEGLFKLFPQPPPTGLDIHYEYVTKNWVQDGTNLTSYKDEITSGADIPLYDKTLISRYLKVKMLEAKGFDSTKAQDDFNQVFSFLTGRDKSPPTLNAGGGGGFPYLDSFRNLPDTGYGGV
jgi:hypothetical protein